METKEMKIQEKKQKNNGRMALKYFSAKGMNEVDNENHVIEVKFAVYGSPDSDRDILIRGCFAKSISERGPESKTNRKIAFLWQHDAKDPIGKILKLEEREDGAYATIKLSDFDAVPNAKRAYYQLKEGDINQFSFGFNYVWDKLEYDETQDAFIVKEVKLFEISVVTFGANEMTGFIGEVVDESQLKSYLMDLSINNKNKFNQIKQAVMDIEAEPGRNGQPLTLNGSMFEKLSKIN